MSDKFIIKRTDRNISEKANHVCQINLGRKIAYPANNTIFCTHINGYKEMFLSLKNARGWLKYQRKIYPNSEFLYTIIYVK